MACFYPPVFFRYRELRIEWTDLTNRAGRTTTACRDDSPVGQSGRASSNIRRVPGISHISQRARSVPQPVHSRLAIEEDTRRGVLADSAVSLRPRMPVSLLAVDPITAGHFSINCPIKIRQLQMDD